jgi:hypothetical protein
MTQQHRAGHGAQRETLPMRIALEHRRTHWRPPRSLLQHRSRLARVDHLHATVSRCDGSGGLQEQRRQGQRSEQLVQPPRSRLPSSFLAFGVRNAFDPRDTPAFDLAEHPLLRAVNLVYEVVHDG